VDDELPGAGCLLCPVAPLKVAIRAVLNRTVTRRGPLLPVRCGVGENLHAAIVAPGEQVKGVEEADVATGVDAWRFGACR